MKRPLAIVILGLVLFGGSLPVQAVQNPLTWGFSTADCGALYYNGSYFLTGNPLAGDILVSDNLTQWGHRTHVIAAAQHTWASYPGYPAVEDGDMMASDVNYINGQFHLYYQIINPTNNSSIAHSISASPLGPYLQPVNTPFLQVGIDAEAFEDDNGSNYFYAVTFNSDNHIVGAALPNLSALGSAPATLLTPLKGTWETRDNRINEGPFVFKYRDRYYMLYNANHTSSSNGNYAIGCAEASTPLGFPNSGKYADPVVDSATQPGGNEWIQNCGQSWVVDGPNGFEKWLGYFAIYSTNGFGTRRQAVDRIYFHNRHFYVDGPTGFFTEGYHPAPRMPGFRDLFSEPDGALNRRNWQTPSGGSWGIMQEELRQTATNRFAWIMTTGGSAGIICLRPMYGWTAPDAPVLWPGIRMRITGWLSDWIALPISGFSITVKTAAKPKPGFHCPPDSPSVPFTRCGYIKTAQHSGYLSTMLCRPARRCLFQHHFPEPEFPDFMSIRPLPLLTGSFTPLGGMNGTIRLPDGATLNPEPLLPDPGTFQVPV